MSLTPGVRVRTPYDPPDGPAEHTKRMMSERARYEPPDVTAVTARPTPQKQLLRPRADLRQNEDQLLLQLDAAGIYVGTAAQIVALQERPAPGRSRRKVRRTRRNNLISNGINIMTIMPIVNIMPVGVAATAQTAHSLSQWRGCTSRLCLFLAHQMATDLKVFFLFLYV